MSREPVTVTFMQTIGLREVVNNDDSGQITIQNLQILNVPLALTGTYMLHTDNHATTTQCNDWFDKHEAPGGNIYA